MEADELTGTERFEILRKLGEGGMGVVYEAYDREREAVVALKTLRTHHGQALSRFKNEFRSLQRLEHPNLVALGELITEGKLSFFTMELVPGVPLLEYVRAGKGPILDPVTPSQDTLRAEQVWAAPAATLPCDEPRLRACLAQLAPAIAALHASGLVHRDLKPSNILVTPEGRLVLLDLGLALDTRPAPASSADADIVGTVAYMAPEQAHTGRVGPAADWYSFGVVLYEALTGQLPHGGDTALELLMNKQRYAPPPPRARNPAVPRDLDQLCEELLSLDPAERPDQREVLDRLGLPRDAATIAPSSAPSIDQSQVMPFVGRDPELARLEAEFAEVQRGATRVVHVEGESGIGKSALLQELAARLPPETLILWGRCYEREQVPYKALDGVIESLTRHLRALPDVEGLLPADAGLLPRLFPSLDRVDAISRAPRAPVAHADPHQVRARAFAALRALLARVCAAQPVVLIVDDIQWTDADSLILLGDLLRPPDPPRLLALFAARPEAPDSSTARSWRAPLVAALEGTPMAFVGLAPLGEASGTELARVLLAAAGRGAAAETVARDAAGHPLFIAELCRHVSAGGGDRPGQLEEVIGARVAALPEATRRLLELICLTGTPMPPTVVGVAAGNPPAELARHLARLRIASLVRTSGIAGHDRVAPYHARVAAAVLGRLDEPTRRAGHGALAAALDRSPWGRDAPELLLRHLDAAGDAAGAARHAEIAATRAAEGLAFDRAAELFREALRLGDHGGEDRRALQLRLAHALADAGRGPEAAAVYLDAAEGADPATRLDCRRAAAEQLILTGHLDEGLRALEQLLAEFGVDWPTTPRRVLASLVWQRMRFRLGGLRGPVRHASEVAEHELRRIDVLRAAGLGLGFSDPARAAYFNVRFLRAALRAGEPSRVVPALGAEAIFQASQGGKGCVRARVLMEKVRALADASDVPYFHAWVSGVDGLTTYFEGRFPEAVTRLQVATARFRDSNGSPWERNSIHLLHLLALRYAGDLVAFRALHDECVRDASRRGDRFLETTARRHGNVLCLAAGDLDAAEDNLRHASWLPPAGRQHLQHWYELESRGEVALYAGDTAAAAGFAEPLDRLFASLLPRVQTVRVAARWLEARMRILGGDPGAARHACKLLAHEDLSTAQVFAALGRAAIEPAARAEHLKAAIAAAEACGMGLHVAGARHRLGTLVGGDEGAGLIAGAEVMMRAQGIVDPVRMVEVIAPGS